MFKIFGKKRPITSAKTKNSRFVQNKKKKSRLPVKKKKPRFVKIFLKKKADYQQKKKNSRFVQNFLKKKYFLKNFDFFTKDVLLPLLGGMKRISGIYHVVFVQ